MVAADAAPDARPEHPVEAQGALHTAHASGHAAPLKVPPGCSLTVDMLVLGHTAVVAAAVPAAPSAEPPSARKQGKAGASPPSDHG